jgi:hypothetical protein
MALLDVFRADVFSLGEHVRDDYRAVIPDLLDEGLEASDVQQVLHLLGG